MSNHRGGRLSRLFGYRPLVAILLCANILIAGVAAHEITPKVSALLADRTKAGAIGTPIYGGCGQTPGKLNPAVITVKRPGLTHMTSQPFYYAVAGATPAAINQQMAACSTAAPGETRGEFAAGTTYVINWQASYHSISNGQCKVNKVAVGLQTRHTYPLWRDAAAPTATATSWNSFIQQLHIHEEGHVTLDQQYAAQILQSLQTMPPAPCQTIRSQTDGIANGLVQALAQANRNYDAATGHGRTQGAVLQ